ncbi:MAG: bifunctional oligoribonuclease/PAP phosphatase NrnA [Clostridia bacterium]|nr:bifunctional oligoribonuclease/PAP phosphatase NrnA [Clostridia bacterium]
MDNIAKIIEESDNIAIIAHSDEDCDALCSSLAMLEMLKNKGKSAVYYLSGAVEHRLNFFEKNYIIYDESCVDKKYDLVICLDSADESRLGKRISLLKNAKKSISIDHHYTNTMYADVNRVDGNMSSTGEMIYNLLLEMNVEITKKIAEYLYSAIMCDTGCLKYSCASPKTAAVISKLMETGIDHADLCRKLFDRETLNAVKLKAFIMNNIKSYYNGRLNITSINEEQFEEYGVSEKDIGDIVNIPRCIEGTEIAVSIRKIPEKIKISFRSNGKYNVGEIAKKFGGGGHEMAAGASITDCTLDEAEKKIAEAIGEVING